MLHGTRDELQELQATPRLQTEGKLVKCEQEAVESVVLAECMNKTVVEVDGVAALDGELAKGVSNVDKGDKTISGSQTWFSSKWNYTRKKTVSAKILRERMRVLEMQDDAYSRRSASVAEQMGRLARRTCPLSRGQTNAPSTSNSGTTGCRWHQPCLVYCKGVAFQLLH